jgi:hypothetical protein
MATPSHATVSDPGATRVVYIISRHAQYIVIDGSKPADYNKQYHEQSEMWQTQQRNVDSQTKLGVKGNSAAVVCAAGGHACDARETYRHACDALRRARNLQTRNSRI